MEQTLRPNSSLPHRLSIDLSALDHLGDVVVVADTENRVLHWSAGAARVYDLPADQAIGRPLDEILPGFGAPAASIQRAIEQTVSAGGWRGEVLHRRPDGSRVYLDLSILLLRDAAGNATGSVLVGRDVTQRVLAEDALRLSEARLANLIASARDAAGADDHQRMTLRALFEALPVAVIGTDLDGKVTTWSREAERLFGWTESEMIGQSMLCIVPPEEQGTIQALYSHPSGERYSVGADRRRVRKDGAIIEVNAWSSALNDSAGKQVGGMVIYADATERKRLERQLLQSQRMESVGRLAGGVAHDFNNLLTSIIGNATFAREEIPEDAQARRDVEAILKSASRAANLTRQLLAFSRRQMLEPQPTDLNELVVSLDKMLRRLLGENIELVMLPQAEQSNILADPGQIEQVVINLAVNARDAMPNGGKITIATSDATLDDAFIASHIGATRGEYALLTISDTGAGLSEEDKTHLFEPFFTTQEAGKGAGLDLASVFGIVKQHGGNIWAESALNEGTTFYIYLPRLSAAPAPAKQEPSAATEKARRETILLVEDEFNVRALAARALRKAGYTVLEAGHGEEALRVAHAHPGQIHLLLTDVVMPIMGGKDLAIQLRSERPRMRIVFMSGYSDQSALQSLLQQSGVAFVQKPFSAAGLNQKVREVLDTRMRKVATPK